MLQIKNLSIYLEINNHRILEDFTFHLANNHRAAIIGEEGNGKSTLLKLIHDPQLVSAYAAYSGQIMKDGMKTGYLPQELPSSEAVMDVYTFLSQEPMFWESTPSELNEIARAVGLDANLFYSDRLMNSFSGGERIKLSMARVMMGKPDLYLLDEPTNDIDIKTIEWLEFFILSLDRPVIYISHDEMLLEKTANCIIHIEQLRKKTMPRHTIASAGYRDYVDGRASAFEHQAQMAKSEQDEYNKKMEKWRQIYQRVHHEQEVVSRAAPPTARLLKKKMHSVLSMKRRFEREKENMTQMPDYEDAIGLAFDEIDIVQGKVLLDYTLDMLRIGERVLAKNIALVLRSGEHVGIIGDNGVGKTTLLRILADQLTEKYGNKCAYMPQNYEEKLNFDMPVVEFLAPSGHKDDITRARTFMGSLKYTHAEMESSAARLSGGQKAKLYFLKIALTQPEILVLDEPTRNLSPLSGPVVRQTLASYTGTILSVSHDRKYLSEVCDKIYRLTPEGLIREDCV